MKTSIIEVHDMLSVLTVDEVEKRVGEVPGVASATVNYAAGNAAVRYDETLLDVAEIKVIVHQRGQQSADASQPKHVSEDKPAPAVPVGAAPAGKAAPQTKPATPEPVVSKAAPVAPTAVAPPASAAVKARPDVKSSTPATDEPKVDSWKVHARSLATTLGVAYISCAVFDLVFPPFGLLAALAPASPLPISGSALALLAGFALFTVAGFVLGALHGIASQFWSKRLR